MAKKPTVTLVSLDTAEAKLQAQLAKLKEQRENLANKEANRVKEVVNSFMEQLSTEANPVTSLADVISTIKKVEKGLIGSVGNSARTYVVLTKEQEEGAVTRLKAGDQVSAIAADLKCSEGKIWGLKKAAGLTETRKETAAIPPATV